jgi:hypothetical protein
MLSEEDAATREKVEKIFRYVNVFWFGTVGPDRFSVFEAERRTNNDVESFHRWLNSRCANTRQNFWSFVSKQISASDSISSNVKILSVSTEIIQKNVTIQKMDFDLASQTIIRRRPKTAVLRRNRDILDAMQSLSSGQLEIYEFLEITSSFTPSPVVPALIFQRVIAV